MPWLSRQQRAALVLLLLLLAEEEEDSVTTTSDSEVEEDPRPRRRLRPRPPPPPQQIDSEGESSSASGLAASDGAIESDAEQSLQQSQQSAVATEEPSHPQPAAVTHQEPAVATRKRSHPQTSALIQQSSKTTGKCNGPKTEESTTDEDEKSVEEGPVYIPPPNKLKRRAVPEGRRRRRRRVAAVDTAEVPESTAEVPESAAEGAEGDDKPKKQKRFWLQNMYRQRERLADPPSTKGIPHLDPTAELKLLGMSEECFETLLTLVSPLIEKKSTLMRQPISPRQRLVAVLRYLVTGQAMEALKFTTLLSPSLMGSSVVHETCQAIIQVLTPKYMKFPEKKEDWQKIASEFSVNCDIPNCGGSLSARHVWIHGSKATANHKNYKGDSSFVLATLVDANHRFVSTEVIMEERDSDVSAMWSSDIYKRLLQESLPLPENTETEGGLNFVFAAPNCYPPHYRLLTTYPAEYLNTHARVTYNDRIRSANQYADNALGLLATKFGILRTPINIQSWKIDPIVRACCVLHNYLSVESRHDYLSDTTYDRRNQAGNMLPGDWRNTADATEHFAPMEPVTHHPSPDTDYVRQQYVDHFSAKLLERDLTNYLQ